MNFFGQPLFPFVLNTTLVTPAACISVPKSVPVHTHRSLSSGSLVTSPRLTCVLLVSHHKDEVAKGEAWSPASLETSFCSSTALQENPTPGNKKLK